MKQTSIHLPFCFGTPHFVEPSRPAGGLGSRGVQQMPGRHKQIRQRASDVRARSIFGDVSMPHLRETSQPFDNQERILHSEMLLISFLRRAHFRIARTIGILERTLFSDDDRIDYRDSSDFQATTLQNPADLGKKTRLRGVLFKHAAIAQDRRFSRL